MSQNYQLVHDHLPAYYGEGSVHTFAIDSSSEFSDYTVFYGFTTIRDTSLWMDGWCLDSLGGGWMGRVLVQSSNKTSILNFNGDSIHYFQQTVPGESHLFYAWPNGNYVEATHFQSTYDEILGVMDSVKYFRLNVFNPAGDSIFSEINGLTYTLSKNYGLVSTFDNYLFPMSYNYQSELSGFSNPVTGISNMDWQDAFNFNIGDEFHIRQENFYWAYDEEDSVTVQGKITVDKIRIVIGVEQLSDSIRFSYKECWRSVDASPISIDTVYVADTIIDETITRQSLEWMDLYPGQYHEGSWNNYSLVSQNNTYDFNSRAIKNIKFNAIEGDTCLAYTIYCPEHMVHRYIEGCGGPYYSYYIEFTSPSRRLKYFKKGSEEWGVPIAADCADLLSGTAEVYSLQKSPIVYPNPFNGRLTIKTETGTIGQIRVYNISGNLLYQSRKESQFHIVNTSLFLSGIYILEIRMEDGCIFRKKIIKK